MMLKLEDFSRLPQVERLIAELVGDGSGLVVVAGLDPRPLAGAEDAAGFLPSGRGAIFRLLVRQILEAHPGTNALVVAEARDVIRVPRSLRHRISLSVVQPGAPYEEAIARAAARRPDLLVIDRLDAGTARAALEAAARGLRVLVQFDTVFRGAEVAHHLLDLGLPDELLASLTWVVAVQRLATLCPHCKEPVPLAAAPLAELRRHYPDLAGQVENGRLFHATGCSRCQHTGRGGEATAFDIYRSPAGRESSPEHVGSLSLEAYMLGLVAAGQLPLEDVLDLEGDRLRRTYKLLALSEAAMGEAQSSLQRRLAELEATNRVLQQRTEALISLEGIGQALIESRGLEELAAQLCRHARDLCGADRSILYYLRPQQDLAEVLAVSGWDAAVLHRPLASALVRAEGPLVGPVPFQGRPPGVPRRPTDVMADALQAALQVPLVVQEEQVGLLIVHTSRKARFTPGKVALLQTFANQAAVAIQRAGLVEALQDKIVQLEIAQAELVQKERMERELELARQVQQSVLPRIFPLVPGYTFAARNRPARQVGGDFYDVVLLDAGRFGVVIGDVSDKGMPAALYMALTRSLLLAEARRNLSPRSVLLSVHRLLQELGQPGLFVTVFYGVVDAPARQLTYARAGHDRPLLLRGGEVRPLGGEGTFLGFPDLDSLHLSEEREELCPGDRLVLYTDGLTDVLAPNGRAFGPQRLARLLQVNASLSPDALCAATFGDLVAYQGSADQYDDMTMLVMGVQ